MIVLLSQTKLPDSSKSLSDNTGAVHNAVPQYSLQADIDFEFSGTNWISHGNAARLAHIRLPDDFSELKEVARTSIVKEKIYKHHQQYASDLPYKGVIKGYRLIVERNNGVVKSIVYGLPKSSDV